MESGWLRFRCTTAQGNVWIVGASPTDPWLLALDRAEVAAEIGAAATAFATGPGVAMFAFETPPPPFYAALDRAAYRPGVRLPDAPHVRFQAAAEDLPRATEAERLVVQRIGQNVFRQTSMANWGGRCPLLGISDPALLRASHIVPWAECATDAERLDVHNGLLLSALWDAAFDAGLVSFADDGAVLVSPTLGALATGALATGPTSALQGLTTRHRANLAWHRADLGFDARQSH